MFVFDKRDYFRSSKCQVLRQFCQIGDFFLRLLRTILTAVKDAHSESEMFWCFHFDAPLDPTRLAAFRYASVIGDLYHPCDCSQPNYFLSTAVVCICFRTVFSSIHVSFDVRWLSLGAHVQRRNEL